MSHTERAVQRSGERAIGDVPSWFNKEQRKAERAKLRREFQQIRSGRLDEDTLPVYRGRAYKRAYYW